ncbi:hypothetical protein HK405_006031 [Cladochytrium tenue]|nr:hypothetical protein HK405_006031 [Cladochytrium tenue]
MPRIGARLYFPGSARDLRRARALVLHIPGGGFISMPPRCHDDYLSMWARRTGMPVVAIDYGKAPEFPYPWALEECFDAYRSIVESNGAVVGLEGWYEDAPTPSDPMPAVGGSTPRWRKRKEPIRIVLSGDSAGGNIATALVLKIIEGQDSFPRPLPVPAGLILIYPCLNFDMACWMRNDERSLLRAESSLSLGVLHVAEAHEHIRPDAPFSILRDAPLSIDVASGTAVPDRRWHRRLWARLRGAWSSSHPETEIRGALSMTSRMSYFNDRVLAPEVLRAMALMYLSSSPIPIDFSSDWLLSPQAAPLELLAKFPRTFLVCGEKDPFIDDTVVFAGRLREARRMAQAAAARERARERTRAAAAAAAASMAGDAHRFQPASQDDDDDYDDGDMVVDEDDYYERAAAARTVSVSMAHLDEIESDGDGSGSGGGNGGWGDAVRVRVLEGMSHAFLQMFALLPEARPISRLLADWAAELVVLDRADTAAAAPVATTPSGAGVMLLSPSSAAGTSATTGGAASLWRALGPLAGAFAATGDDTGPAFGGGISRTASPVPGVLLGGGGAGGATGDGGSGIGRPSSALGGLQASLALGLQGVVAPAPAEITEDSLLARRRRTFATHHRIVAPGAA